MKRLSVGHGESQETPQQTLARLNAGTRTATPVAHGPTKPSEGFGERLAHISQRRWRIICLAFWPSAVCMAVMVFGLVDDYWPNSTPDDAGVAMLFAFGVAVLGFWLVGATRTAHIDPSEWTALQRASKHVWSSTPSATDSPWWRDDRPPGPPKA